MISSPLERLINLLVSERCLICSKNTYALCEACFYSNYQQIVQRCYMCNKLTKTSGVCNNCSSRLRRIWWLGYYEEFFKTLIWQMKFGRQRSHAKLFGNYLAQTLPFLSEETVVVSIPTSAKRVRMRGFDQAKLIAQTFAQKRGLNYMNLLQRTSNVDLIGKSRLERRKVMAKSISVSEHSILQGSSVILIDDVLTTGATLEAAAGILRQVGAKHVDAAVVARKLLN